MLLAVDFNDEIKDLPAHVASGSRKKFCRVVELCVWIGGRNGVAVDGIEWTGNICEANRKRSGL